MWCLIRIASAGLHGRLERTGLRKTEFSPTPFGSLGSLDSFCLLGSLAWLSALLASLRSAHRAIKVAREFSLTVSVRSGGHSATGLSILGQIVIDLTKTLNSVWVLEPDSTHPEPYVRVDGGARVADVDEIIARRGYVTALGAYQGIGMGSVLQGGLGYLSRRFGLSVDQIVEAEVVTAEGVVVVCNEKENSGGCFHVGLWRYWLLTLSFW